MARWGSCDFRQLERLQEKLEKLNRDKTQFCEQCSKELAARLLRRVIKRTPPGKAPEFGGEETTTIQGASGRTQTFLSATGARAAHWEGYKGGTLRRGWTGGKSQTAFVESLRVYHSGDRCIITITNPVEYASYVEYGHRQEVGRYVPAIGKRLKVGWVNGKFMLTKSEQEVERLAPALLEKRLMEFLKEALDD